MRFVRLYIFVFLTLGSFICDGAQAETFDHTDGVRHSSTTTRSTVSSPNDAERHRNEVFRRALIDKGYRQVGGIEWPNIFSLGSQLYFMSTDGEAHPIFREKKDGAEAYTYYWWTPKHFEKTVHDQVTAFYAAHNKKKEAPLADSLPPATHSVPYASPSTHSQSRNFTSGNQVSQNTQVQDLQQPDSQSKSSPWDNRLPPNRKSNTIPEARPDTTVVFACHASAGGYQKELVLYESKGNYEFQGAYTDNGWIRPKDMVTRSWNISNPRIDLRLAPVTSAELIPLKQNGLKFNHDWRDVAYVQHLVTSETDAGGIPKYAMDRYYDEQKNLLFASIIFEGKFTPCEGFLGGGVSKLATRHQKMERGELKRWLGVDHNLIGGHTKAPFEIYKAIPGQNNLPMKDAKAIECTADVKGIQCWVKVTEDSVGVALNPEQSKAVYLSLLTGSSNPSTNSVFPLFSENSRGKIIFTAKDVFCFETSMDHEDTHGCSYLLSPPLPKIMENWKEANKDRSESWNHGKTSNDELKPGDPAEPLIIEAIKSVGAKSTHFSHKQYSFGGGMVEFFFNGPSDCRVVWDEIDPVKTRKRLEESKNPGSVSPVFIRKEVNLNPEIALRLNNAVAAGKSVAKRASAQTGEVMKYFCVSSSTDVTNLEKAQISRDFYKTW